MAEHLTIVWVVCNVLTTCLKDSGIMCRNPSKSEASALCYWGLPTCLFRSCLGALDDRRLPIMPTCLGPLTQFPPKAPIPAKPQGPQKPWGSLCPEKRPLVWRPGQEISPSSLLTFYFHRPQFSHLQKDLFEEIFFEVDSRSGFYGSVLNLCFSGLFEHQKGPIRKVRPAWRQLRALPTVFLGGLQESWTTLSLHVTHKMLEGDQVNKDYKEQFVAQFTVSPFPSYFWGVCGWMKPQIWLESEKCEFFFGKIRSR